MTLILGIESSCDETAASVSLDGRKILSDVIWSQADLHKKYGGVVPEIASRKHIEYITYVVNEALEKAGVSASNLDAVAVTSHPGLIGALLVGVSFAKGFAYSLKKPLVPVNHIHGHICANYIAYPELEPPFICLVASGGHSHIVRVDSYSSYTVLGATTDDAAGEAFDKVARVLGLGYPGGPLLSQHAEKGNPSAITFPRSVFGLDFSFSGIKTSVINYLNRASMTGQEVNTHDVAASFEAAVTDVLCDTLTRAALDAKINKIALAGGVAANRVLREKLLEKSKELNMDFFVPPPVLCTDNGSMISCAGYYAYKNGERATLDLNATATLKI